MLPLALHQFSRRARFLVRAGAGHPRGCTGHWSASGRARAGHGEDQNGRRAGSGDYTHVSRTQATPFQDQKLVRENKADRGCRLASRSWLETRSDGPRNRTCSLRAMVWSVACWCHRTMAPSSSRAMSASISTATDAHCRASPPGLCAEGGEDVTGRLLWRTNNRNREPEDPSGPERQLSQSRGRLDQRRPTWVGP